MDNPVITNVPNVAHVELIKAQAKQDKLKERAETNVGFGATVGGMTITANYHAKVTETVIAKLSGPRGRPQSMEFKIERLLRQLRPEVLALCILQSGLHAVAIQGNHTVAVLRIGEAINDECFAFKLLQTDKKLAGKINKRVKESFGSVEVRKAVAKKAAADAGFTLADWTEGMLAHAGQWGMNVLLECLPDVFQLTEPQGHRGTREWTLTDGGEAMAEAAMAEAVVKSPVYQPRTERPADWGHFFARVAEDDRTVARAQLLRTGHKDIISAAKHAMKTGTMAPTLRAINTLQSVPFVINTWIMDIIQECYDRNIKVDGLPSQKPLPVPERLSSEAFSALSVEERRLLSKTIRGIKRANRSLVSERFQFSEDMEVAKRQSVVEQFYCPMNMDWRGRVYSLTHFNFQREDRVRAMFLFANGETIGDEGIEWLKIHTANCGDFGKVSKRPMEERIKWCDDNLELMTDYVKRPLYNTGWTEADAPFLFLAACRELVTALEVGPSNHVCHLPVSFDGSCSGLQHLAAMTRAPEGALVNLTNNEIPADVYQTVADLDKERITEDLSSEELFGKADDDKPERKTIAPIKKLAAIALSYGVDRSLVKRNVMTFAYSSKEFGMSEQHFEDTMEPLELKWLKGELQEHPFGETDDEWRLSSRYLAKRTLAAIKDVVRLPAEAMEFMQKLAKVMAHEGKPLRWTSPAGLPCINRYHDSTTEVIELWCYDKGVKRRMQMKVADGYEHLISKDKAAAGIAPNFVHSHDAAHLLLTVAASADEGIPDIATVHDSFGCLPSRATRFNQIIREQFLDMYVTHDVLAELLASAKADLTEASHSKLPELPMYGTLDLKEILNARYAFA
jgi:DNA-directed RNA polymerase